MILGPPSINDGEIIVSGGKDFVQRTHTVFGDAHRAMRKARRSICQAAVKKRGASV